VVDVELVVIAQAASMPARLVRRTENLQSDHILTLTAFRDRQLGRDRNRQNEPQDASGEKRRDRGRGRGGPRRGGDRHSRTAVG
jgi:hypothetical protein